MAFTSNTFQVGAKPEAGIEMGPISAHGYFAFDALIQFRPFFFDSVLAPASPSRSSVSRCAA